MSDDLLAAALPLMLNLCEIVLDHCHNITVASLWCLLEQPNDLSNLHCWQCKQITMEDKKRIESVITDENLYLYFEWYPYIEVEEALLEAGYLENGEESEEEDSVAVV